MVSDSSRRQRTVAPTTFICGQRSRINHRWSKRRVRISGLQCFWSGQARHVCMIAWLSAPLEALKEETPSASLTCQLASDDHGTLHSFAYRPCKGVHARGRSFFIERHIALKPE